MAKYIFAKYREWGVQNSFGRDTYYHHLRVWNDFKEENPCKRSFEDFLNSFVFILDSTKNEGFIPSQSKITVSRDKGLVNGAHRTAACLLYNKPVYARETSETEWLWNLEYFRKRGLAEKYLDAMAIQYCELKPNTYVLIVFPSAVGYATEVDNIVIKYTSVFYKKFQFFNPVGAMNVILHAYEGEPFIQDGRRVNYPNANAKAKACFPHNLLSSNPARIYLVEATDIGKIQKCKNEIRTLFNIGNDSVHATDTHEQAIMMARAFFNKNSIHFLNHRKFIYADRFDALFERYKEWVRADNKIDEWFCVDSGAVLACYGLRDCNDLDYIHFKDAFADSGILDINGHNQELIYHDWDRDAIIFNPDFHFYYKGMKFCSLAAIRIMKENRGEPKDLRDIDLIDSVLTK